MDVIPCAMFQTSALPMTRLQPLAPRARQAGATLSEVFPATGAEAAAAGFVVAHLGHGVAPVLWIRTGWHGARRGSLVWRGLVCAGR